MEMDLNLTIFNDLGNFGDIVERSRLEIIDGFIRPDVIQGLEDIAEFELVELEPLPKRLPNITVATFDESSKRRWNFYNN